MTAWWSRWRVSILSTLGLIVTLLVGFVTGRTSWGHIVHVGTKVGEPSAGWLPVAVDGMMLVGAIMAWVDNIRGYKPRLWSIIALWFGSLGTVTFNVLSAFERGWAAMVVAAVPAVAFLVTVECVFHPSRRLLDAAIEAVAEAVNAVASPAPESVETPPVAAPVPEPAPVEPEPEPEPEPVPAPPKVRKRRSASKAFRYPVPDREPTRALDVIDATIVETHENGRVEPVFMGPAVVDPDADMG